MVQLRISPQTSLLEVADLGTPSPLLDLRMELYTIEPALSTNGHIRAGIEVLAVSQNYRGPGPCSRHGSSRRCPLRARPLLGTRGRLKRRNRVFNSCRIPVQSHAWAGVHQPPDVAPRQLAAIADTQHRDPQGKILRGPYLGESGFVYAARPAGENDADRGKLADLLRCHGVGVDLTRYTFAFPDPPGVD